MKTDKKFNILTAFTMLFFVFILSVMVLICIFPGDADSIATFPPWHVWVIVGGTLGYVAALLIFFFIAHEKDKKTKEDQNKT
jgi:hypothetical protein